MSNINGVDMIRKHFIWLNEQNTTPGTNLEIDDALFTADQDVIFGTINDDYLNREMEWYKSQSRKVSDMSDPVPEIWQNMVDDKGMVNSNYGWCVFSEENGNQYNSCRNELLMNRDSRRATMIYQRPSMHVDATANGMNDFICTNCAHVLIRDNNLIYTVNMRSSDAIYGYKYDLKWHEYVYEKLFQDLVQTYPVLTYHNLLWFAHLLHIYAKHRYLIDESAQA